MAMLGQFLRVLRNFKFAMVGLDRDYDPFWKCNEITLWTEICLDDAVYHEADHYLKWPRSANVRIF